MDYDQDAYDEEKQEYIVSFAQLEQLGPRQREGVGMITKTIEQGGGMGAALRMAGKMKMDPLDRFKLLASIYYTKFGGDSSFAISWETIISKIPLVKWVRYKNPICFILGARIINSKMEIDASRLAAVTQSFKETLTTEAIVKEDILRYARYWKTLL